MTSTLAPFPRVATGHHAPPQTERQQLFDHYWDTRDLCSTDWRTRLRIGLVDRLLGNASGQMLDVGCGRGTVASFFSESGFDVTAIDISPQALEWTRRQNPDVRTALVDLETDDLAGTYDAILCLEVLQQVRQPVDVLIKLKDTLSEHGTMIVSLPNEFHLARRLSILLGHVNFGGIEDTHIKLYSVVEHGRLFHECGLRVIQSFVQSIVPPRWFGGWLHRLTNRIASRLPGLFALSVVYRLEPMTDTEMQS